MREGTLFIAICTGLILGASVSHQIAERFILFNFKSSEAIPATEALVLIGGVALAVDYKSNSLVLRAQNPYAQEDDGLIMRVRVADPISESIQKDSLVSILLIRQDGLLHAKSISEARYNAKK